VFSDKFRINDLFEDSCSAKLKTEDRAWGH